MLPSCLSLQNSADNRPYLQRQTEATTSHNNRPVTTPEVVNNEILWRCIFAGRTPPPTTTSVGAVICTLVHQIGRRESAFIPQSDCACTPKSL
jgi:hypothetical protein